VSRLWFCILAILFLVSPPAFNPAHASPGRITLGNPCTLSGAPEARATELAFQPDRFICTIEARQIKGSTIWSRFVLPKGVDLAGERWEFSHGVTQATAEHIWVGTADGKLVPAITKRENARRILGGSSQVFALPQVEGANILLTRVDNLQNRRGATPRAALTTATSARDMLMTMFLVFGLLTGGMAGIMFYNLTLYGALRYPVLLSYSVLIIANLIYGLIWSNGILYFFPGMSTATQFNLHALSISVCFATGGLFFTTFIEEGKLPVWLKRIVHGTSLTGLSVALLRCANPPIPWLLLDTATYLSFLIILAMTLIGSAIAAGRGSVAVRYHFLAWILPLIVITARTLWGMGMIQTESALFEASNFIVVSVEALLSSIGLAWRLKQLRSERDVAQVRADEFYTLANIDPLTGIANRRAFMEQAMRVGAANERVHLILIDIDRFKFVNDGFGHDAGDTVLIRVAAAIEASGVPVIGRLGGDEFAILVEREDAAKIGRKVSKNLVTQMGPSDLAVTISVGIANGPLNDDQDWQLLYVAADQALYRSKRGGRAQMTEALTA
jgi:diguanylate cyclase (GGDEF)-like protein